MFKCEECGLTSNEFSTCWSAFYVSDPESESDDRVLVTYCSDCLAREFGGILRWLTAVASTRQV